MRLYLLVGLMLGLVYLASLLALPRRYGHVIVGDGVHYFVYAHSLLIDGDLDFANEYAEFNRATTDPGKTINATLRTPTGLVFNMFAVGPALVSLPFYAIGHGLSLLAHAAGLPVGTDGYGMLAEGAYALAGVVAAVSAAACTHGTLRRLLGRGPTLVGVASIWLGGSLLYYTVASPSYAHAFSALGVVAWALWWAHRIPGGARHWLVLGLLGGLMACMRWQEGLVAVLPLLLWGWDVLRGCPGRAGALADHGNQPSSPSWWLAPPAYVLGLLIGFAPQFVAWTILFGTPLAVPQGASFFTWQEPHWFDVLFSTRNGLFTWTPVALLGVIGLIAVGRRAPRWALVGLAAFVLQWLLNGLLLDWWAGASFGGRRFIGLSVFLALGVGYLAELAWPRRSRLIIVSAVLLIGLNGLLLGQYSAALKGWTPLETYPTLQQMTVDRFLWPVRLLTQRGASAGDG